LAQSTVTEVLAFLRASKRSLRCSEACAALQALGYSVRPGRAGHKVFDHPQLEWMGSNFDCGHGRDPELRLPYVQNLIRVIESHAATLRELRGENNENDL
jgi:hypothetical protein